MNNRLAAIAAALCLALLPATASAYDAYAAKDVHLRAGPRRDYPVVAILPRGAPVDVLGCLSDYSWCDVIALGDRGWVYAGNLDFVYQGAPVTVLDYGAVIGIGVVVFVLGDYWDRHYHARPWYPHRDEWIHRPRPVQPPLPVRPRPPVVTVPPPMPPPVRREPPRAAPPPRHVPPPRPPHAAPSPPHATPPPRHVPPPRSAEPGRPPVVSGDSPKPRK